MSENCISEIKRSQGLSVVQILNHLQWFLVEITLLLKRSFELPFFCTSKGTKEIIHYKVEPLKGKYNSCRWNKLVCICIVIKMAVEQLQLLWIDSKCRHIQLTFFCKYYETKCDFIHYFATLFTGLHKPVVCNTLHFCRWNNNTNVYF